MIYFIATSSVFNNSPIRQFQYTTAISKLKLLLSSFPADYRLIIVENNGNRHTFLNELHDTVFYTYNNFLNVSNKGIKELQDVFDCIQHFNIQDDDFIVKLTARYILHDDTPFLEAVKNLHQSMDCIIRYGSCFGTSTHKIDDCITGLIGMRCFYLKLIQFPLEHECGRETYGFPYDPFPRFVKLYFIRDHL